LDHFEVQKNATTTTKTLSDAISSTGFSTENSTNSTSSANSTATVETANEAANASNFVAPVTLQATIAHLYSTPTEARTRE